MAELESVIEQKLIEQLIYGDSQWTYREDSANWKLVLQEWTLVLQTA